MRIPCPTNCGGELKCVPAMRRGWKSVRCDSCDCEFTAQKTERQSWDDVLSYLAVTMNALRAKTVKESR